MGKGARVRAQRATRPRTALNKKSESYDDQHQVSEGACADAHRQWEAFLVAHDLEVRCPHGHIEAYVLPEHPTQEIMAEYVVRLAILDAAHDQPERLDRITDLAAEGQALIGQMDRLGSY